MDGKADWWWLPGLSLKGGRSSLFISSIRGLVSSTPSRHQLQWCRNRHLLALPPESGSVPPAFHFKGGQYDIDTSHCCRATSVPMHRLITALVKPRASAVRPGHLANGHSTPPATVSPGPPRNAPDTSRAHRNNGLSVPTGEAPTTVDFPALAAEKSPRSNAHHYARLTAPCHLASSSCPPRNSSSDN